MTWSGFFGGIQDFFENVAFAPFNALRALELSNWWAANIMTWIFKTGQFDSIFRLV